MVQDFIKEIEPKLVKWRREFHRYPELGFLEYVTTYKLGIELKKLGFEIHIGDEAMDREARLGLPGEEIMKIKETEALNHGVDQNWLDKMSGGMTGLVATWDTGKPGDHTAFRFDIDALPIKETDSGNHFPNQEAFTSTVKQVMHACGHDGHMTIGLGVATYIATHDEQLNGKFTLLFQPAEEGGRGARAMTAKGWLDDVDDFYSGHIGINDMSVGTIAATVQGFLASTKFNATFKGVSSHAGMRPEAGKNALLAAAAAATNMYTIPRHSDGITRVNVGKLVAGSGRNIIPEDAYLEIETRGETKEIGVYMHEEAVRIAKAASMMHHVECHIEHVGVTESFICDEELISPIQKACEGSELIKEVLPIANVSGSEDASFMINRVQEKGGKATYMLFGTKLDNPHHHPAFDFQEGVLVVAVEALTKVIERGHVDEK